MVNVVGNLSFIIMDNSLNTLHVHTFYTILLLHHFIKNLFFPVIVLRGCHKQTAVN